MPNTGKWLWVKTSMIAVAAAAGLALWHRHSSAPGDALAVSVYVILALGAGWLGALAGGLIEWRVHRRSPFTPMFDGWFGWLYRQRLWLRFALVFAAGWAAFVLISVVVAALAGAYDDVWAFFSSRGILAVLIFLLIFGLEGAAVGGVADLLRYFSRKK